MWIAFKVRELERRRDVSGIRALLNQPSTTWRGRKSIIGSLRAIDSAESVDLLEEIAKTDSHELLRGMATKALGESSQAGAEQSLLSLREDSNELVLIQLAEALGKMTSHTSVERLAELRECDSEKVRWTALKALGKRNGPDVVAAILPALDDKSKLVRNTAADYLADSGDPRAVEAIRDRLEKETGASHVAFSTYLSRAERAVNQAN